MVISEDVLWVMYNSKEIMSDFEVFTAVLMKNAVFWDIKTEFVPHRRNITSPLQSPTS
jgi:hypothetical protein